MTMTHPGPASVLGRQTARCKRFAAVVQDGTVTTIRVSEGGADSKFPAGEDPAGDADPSQTCADNILKLIK